jgi:hypothetical protein
MNHPQFPIQNPAITFSLPRPFDFWCIHPIASDLYALQSNRVWQFQRSV